MGRLKQVHVYLHENTLEKLDAVSSALGRKRSELIRELIIEFLSRPENRALIEGGKEEKSDPAGQV